MKSEKGMTKEQLIAENERLKKELKEIRAREQKIEIKKDNYLVQLLAMEAAHEGIAILDENEMYIYLNKAHAQIYGYESPEELIGKSWRMLYYKSEIDTFEKFYMPVLARKGHWFGTSVGKRKDGTKFNQEVSLTAINGGGLICVVRDISERKRTEEALVESEDKYRTLVDNIQDGVFLIQDKKLIFVNEAFARMIGYKVEELLHISFDEVITKEDIGLVHDRYEKRLKGINVPREYEFRLLHKDGKRKVNVNMNVGVVNYRGKMVSIGTIKDITDRKREEAMERHRTEQILRNQKAIVELAKENFSDLNFALRKIADVAASTLDVEQVTIWKFDKNHAQMRGLLGLKLSSGYFTIDEIIQVGKYPKYFSALEMSRTIAAVDAITDPVTCEFADDYLTNYGITSMLDAPVRIHGETVGVVCCEHIGPQREWTSEDQDFAGTIADMVSLAMESLERKRTENERKILYEIGEAVSTTENLDELLMTIHRNIEKVMYAENCYIALYDPLAEQVSFPLFVDKYDPPPKPRAKRRGITEYILRTGKPLLLTQEILDDLHEKGEVEIIGTLPESWLAVPLYVRYKVMGVLVVQSYDPKHKYTERDQELLVAIGNQAAVAIDRKQGEEALRESEERFRAIFETAQDVIFLKDKDLRYITINPATEKIFKMESKDIVGKTDADVFGEDVAQFNEAIDRKALSGEIVVREESGLVEKGEQRSFDVIRVPMKDSAGEIFGLCGIARDITELKQSKTILAEEKERLAVTLRSIADGVITTDIYGNVLLINKVAEVLTAWRQKDAEGEHISKIFNFLTKNNKPPRKHPIDRVLRTGRIINIENGSRLIAQDGSEKMISHSWAPIKDMNNKVVGAVLVFRDITERRKIEEELQKANKLESVGTLAGGIAHDFNNILTAILGNITLAKMDIDQASETYEVLSEVEKASLRAKDLTQQLLTFSIGGAPVKKTATIQDLIKDSTAFALRGSNVQYEFTLPNDLWPVEVDVGQMNQVIQNLVINADQAMPEGGVVKVECSNIVLDKHTKIFGRKSIRRNFVEISIHDQGHGIQKEHLDKIFDPYFTTKQKGSGLGLATVYSIIKKHQGYITVDSKLGEGTTFNVYLPASEKINIPGPRTEIKHSGGDGRILVMDDEEIIRTSFKRMVGTLGYTVDSVSDGSEMIKKFRQARKDGHPYDVLIMDLTVPGGMGGKETISNLKKIDPDVRAIVTSGYSNAPVMSNYEKYGFCGYLSKPFKIEELATVIKNALKQ